MARGPLTLAAALLVPLAAAVLVPVAAAAQPEGYPLPLPTGRARIGLLVQPMTSELREHLGAPKDAGVLVVRVDEGSPAAEAGVRVGDVLTRAGGETVDAPHDLMALVARVPQGETLALGLVRDGKKLELEVKPSGRPWPEANVFPDWMRSFQGLEALQRRLDELERRMDELEHRMPEAKPT